MIMATLEVGQQASSDKSAIRPFRASFPDSELSELRRRISATRWPERETVADQSQGVQLATTQALARYWANRIRLAQVSKRNSTPCRNS
jgi:hypothetical protein